MSEYEYREGETRAFMPKAHAEAILRDQCIMPRPNEPCSMACCFAFACAQFNENKPCRGFQLLSNGKLERHIKQNILMDQFDRLGVERYIQMIQQTDSPTIKAELLPVVYRFLKPPEKKEKLRTMIGYTQYEISDNGSLSLIPEPQPEKSKVPDSEPECLRMLRMNQQKGDEKEK